MKGTVQLRRTVEFGLVLGRKVRRRDLEQEQDVLVGGDEGDVEDLRRQQQDQRLVTIRRRTPRNDSAAAKRSPGVVAQRAPRTSQRWRWYFGASFFRSFWMFAQR